MSGVAMGWATAFFLPNRLEGPCWIAIFLVCAILVARRAPGLYFLHGFLVGWTNWVWITTSHVVFFRSYAARHAAELAAMREVYRPFLPALMHRYGVPIPGASAIVIGSLAWIASRIPPLRGARPAGR
jgi:hypothetical protein